MINIEKEFYNKINEQFGNCDRVAFHLTEMGALTTTKMEQYLIKTDFKKMREDKKSIHTIYEELADKYSKSPYGIQYIIEKT